MRNMDKNYRFKSKKIWSAVVLFCFMLALTACNSIPGPTNTVPITDMVGRTVMIPENPQRISGLDPFAGTGIIMFGWGDKMVATVGGVQRDLLLQAMCPSLADAAVVKQEGSVNAEALLNLRVDLIITRGDVYANTAEREKLDKLGIPYVVIEYDTMEDQCRAMLLIGEVLGEPEKAAAYEKYYRDTIEEVAGITAEIPDELKPTLYHSLNIATRTDVAGSLGAEWTELVGAKNVSLRAQLLVGETNYVTTLEQIFVWDPDVIICNETGVNQYILTNPMWQGLRAVREGRVYQIPIGISRMGHHSSIETPLAIWWLAELLYPDYYPESKFLDELKWFYVEFFDYELDEKTIENILSGYGIRTPGTGTGQ